MLRIRNLHSYYGPIEALHGLNLEIGEKSIVCLIGSNGAGKTTLLKSISGMIRRTGSIEYGPESNDIIAMSPKKIAKMGILHVPEGRHVFPGLTVKENLEVGTVTWRSFIRGGSIKEDIEKVYELFPRLSERRNQLSWSMSGGEQQMLAIGRALMGRPKLLLLDEPSMGLAPVIVNELFKKIQEINRQGIPILLVEQNAKLALEISDYAYVIEEGKIVVEGESKGLLNDPRVTEAYLGRVAKS